jgi:hypothetical protein
MTGESVLHLRPLQDDGNGEDSSDFVSCATPDRQAAATSLEEAREAASASELKVVRFASESDDAVAVDIDDNRHSTDHGSGNDGLSSILHAPDIQWTLRTRAFRTCLVLAMPWAAYAILSAL